MNQPRFRWVDCLGEALSELAERPLRSVLTALGTAIGVGTLVAVLGLTSSASAQVSAHFDALRSVEVRITDARSFVPVQAEAFPPDAEQRLLRLNGVRDAGRWWKPAVTGQVTTVPQPTAFEAQRFEVVAASPGLLDTVGMRIREGRTFDVAMDDAHQQVALVSAALAAQLELTDVSRQPAIFIDGTPFTVIGVFDEVVREPSLLLSIIVPRQSAIAAFGVPSANDAQSMLVVTDNGAAVQVAGEVAVALRPDRPQDFAVVPPPDPRQLREQVDTSLAGLFLVLAGVSLVIGVMGIANMSLVGVMERTGEIGLRRALGAQPRHIGAQIMTEAGMLGALGAGIGATLGLLTVIGVALAQRWTAVVDPLIVLLSPLAGIAVGGIAGLYPALRAARIQPAEAVRR